MAWNEPGGNGKDPWGSRNSDQGPPDLEEIVKKMQNKLGGMFGGGGSGGDSDGEGISWSVFAGILVVVLLVWAFFGFYIVQPAEKGVETRFGQYTRTTTQGLNWHFPYPIETVQIVNVEEIKPINHEALMLTQDENIIELELNVQYRVEQPEHYLFNVREPDNTLHQATESALREVVGRSLMEEILTTERTRIAQESKVLIQAIIDRYKTGLSVVSVNMQNAQPPQQVQAAFADVIKAREDEERDKNRAQAYANEVIQKASGTADKLRQEALAYKAQVTAGAEGETKRFLSILTEYEKAPEITRQRIYLETLEEVFTNSRKVLLDIDSGNNLLMLPLNQFMSPQSSGIPMNALPLSQSAPEQRSNSPLRPNFNRQRGREDRGVR